MKLETIYTVFQSRKFKSWLKIILTLGICFAVSIYAADDQGLAPTAQKLTTSVTSFASLVLAIAEIAGFAFAIAGIMKFKQHRDNPAQITLSQPITLFLIGLCLIWLPTLLGGGGLMGTKTIIHCVDKSGQLTKDCLPKESGSGS
jgi:intracellular multiplication protein IcmD